MEAPATFPLFAITHALREAGLPVSVRDVLDGISALETLEDPFSYLSCVEDAAEPDRRRLARRARLVWLVQTLWARSEVEREIVRRTIENDIRPALPMHVLALDEAARPAPHGPDSPSDPPLPRPPSADPLPDLLAPQDDQAALSAAADDSPEEDALAGLTRRERLALNVPVPAIEDHTLGEDVPFELSDAPLLDELSLSAIWRRFRQPVLRIDGRRVDIDRSIQATIRSGGQLKIEPALRRTNQARLIVLLDQSMTMTPWATTSRQFEATLESSSSRLSDVAIYHFSGIPGSKVFVDKGLRRPRPLTAVLQEWTGAPMMVFGDAGAIRGLTEATTARLDRFLAETRRADIRPLCWINPMPVKRWAHAFRDGMSREGHAHAFELGHEAMIAMVTVMREQAK